MKTVNNLTKRVIVLSIITSSVIYATNGDKLIGVGAKTRAMGGAGIAINHGAESTLVNPALITKVKSTDITLGGTIFVPTIKTDLGLTGKLNKSNNEKSIIPLALVANKLYNSIYFGIGMYGTAGLGVDFRTEPSLMEMEATLQLLQFAMPVAYKYGPLSVGASIILQYGSLDINYKNYMSPSREKVGYGQQQDYGYGANVGVAYDFDNGLTVGAVYKSKVEMSYLKVIPEATKPFGLKIGSLLTQPAEIGVGVAYIYGPHSIALDYKKILWSLASGYKDFGWKDQNVIALGYEYKQDKYSIRVGYNHATSPLDIKKGDTQKGAILNAFNVLGFPATSKNHFTIGVGYKINKNLTLDLAFVYSPKEKTRASLKGIGMNSIYNEHTEVSMTAQVSYKF